MSDRPYAPPFRVEPAPDPVIMRHQISFETKIEDSVGGFDHALIANTVTQRLEKLGPLLIEEATLVERLKAVRAKIRGVNGSDEV